MIQVEIIEAISESELVNDINYFLEQLENHLYIDIKYSPIVINDSKNKVIKYTALIIYRIE